MKYVWITPNVTGMNFLMDNMKAQVELKLHDKYGMDTVRNSNNNRHKNKTIISVRSPTQS